MLKITTVLVAQKIPDYITDLVFLLALKDITLPQVLAMISVTNVTLLVPLVEPELIVIVSPVHQEDSIITDNVLKSVQPELGLNQNLELVNLVTIPV